jgi:hypothetical protein
MITRLGPASRVTLLVLALLLALAGGATAKGKYDAKLAKNSDKVDGKHAVPATASPAKRKGKLVATNPQTGRLPDDIVGTVARARKADDATSADLADDAAALGGVPAAALRTVTLSVTSAGAGGAGAGVFVDQAQLSQGADGTLSWTLVLPPDHDPADAVFVDLIYAENSDAACSWFAATGGILETDDGFANSAWYLPGTNVYSGPVNVPAGTGDAHRVTFTLVSGGRQPGSLVTFTLSRQPGNVVDNCQEVGLRGIQFRY